MRQAAGRHFADVVIGVAPDAAVGQGHAAADAVEEAIERALPETDVVVHVEPLDVAGLRERIQVAAASVPQVREIHNVSAVGTDEGVAVSLHLKLPGALSLEQAHMAASDVEAAIERAAPEVTSVQTHLEPLSEEAAGRELTASDTARDVEIVGRIVRDATGQLPRALRFLRTEDGLVAFLTLALDPHTELAEAHSRASAIEEEIRRAVDVSDVIVHTEP
jgi:divalent metal cation (Fe/Co/Zn/Cd) transporter